MQLQREIQGLVVRDASHDAGDPRPGGANPGVRQGRDGCHDRRLGKQLRPVGQHEFQRGIGDRQDDVNAPPGELALDVIAQGQGGFLRGKAIRFQVLGKVVDGLLRVR